MRVTIPACRKHEGLKKLTGEIGDTCPACGGPRGEIVEKRSFDGSLSMVCDGWSNPCGHVDKYPAVRDEIRLGRNDQDEKTVHPVGALMALPLGERPAHDYGKLGIWNHIGNLVTGENLWKKVAE